MQLRSTCLPLLFLLALLQSPQESLRQHYQAAEGYARAGNVAAADKEYRAILALSYNQLGKNYLAQQAYANAVTALEAAARYDADAPDTLVALAIAYFDAEQFKPALAPLTKALTINPQDI